MTSAVATTGEVTLVEEFTWQADLEAPLDAGPGPYGQRMIFRIVGGRVQGPRISAETLSGGADWLTVGADGVGRIDVRSQLRTDDGAVVYVQYQGVIEMNEAVGTALASGGETGFGDQHFRTVLRLETGDERYAWLNQRLFIARGRLRAGGLEYTAYRVD